MTSELLVLSFKEEQGARNFAKDLVALQHDHLIQLEAMSAVIKLETGALKIKSGQKILGHTFLAGSAWGLLTGALFFEPFLGLIVGGLCGAITGDLLERSGPIKRQLLSNVGETKLEPGQSALLLLVRKATPDKLLKKLSSHDATIVQTSLSTENERALRRAWLNARDARSNPVAIAHTLPTSKKTRKLTQVS